MVLFEKKGGGGWGVGPEGTGDYRGFFARAFCQKEFTARGIDFRVAQCDLSSNKKKGTLRGMHCQLAPHAEAKLVCCMKGAIYDVIIDLRPDSLTFKRWAAVELSEDNRRIVYVPKGFAHGFQTLVDGAEVFYMMSEFYHPECAKGVRWNDPVFAIEWPLPVTAISESDANYGDYAEDRRFQFQGSDPVEIRPPTGGAEPENRGLGGVLARAGENERLREDIFEALRQAEAQADDRSAFRNQVRLPIIRSLLPGARTHRVILKNGLIFDVGPDSRIEEALLLSASAHPDHVWEPQTTKLLVTLGADARHVIVGGAYIGDQVLPVARAMAERDIGGVVHAFEPMQNPFDRLLHHLKINGITNVWAHQLALWDKSNVPLSVEGAPALASSLPVSNEQGDAGVAAQSITIDDYVARHRLPAVGLIMLDTEGGEEKALLGASKTLSRPFPESPHLVFEVHRSYVDWSAGLENTSLVNFVKTKGYAVFAIRDFHDNYAMAGRPIEIIPVDRIYLDGPPHGFNLLASKDPEIVSRLGLRVVENVSPKLLLHKDPALHHPLDGP